MADPVKLTRVQALAVLKHCGFKSAEKWDDKKIQEKLKSIPEIKPKEDPTDAGTLADLQLILQTIEAKGSFEVQGEPKAEGEVATGSNGEVKDAQGEKPEKKKGFPPKEPSPYQRVRPSRTAAAICGEVFAKFGTEQGITDEMVADYAARQGKDNPAVAESYLVWAWHVLRGYQGHTEPQTEPAQEEVKAAEPAAV